MKTTFAYFDETPVSVQVTLRELDKLIELTQGAEGPYRVLAADLVKAHKDALASIGMQLEHDQQRSTDK